MEIVRLPVGKQAPIDADCMHIEEAAEGVFKLTASALCVGTDDAESVSLVDAPAFESVGKAEVAGLTWAANVGVRRLFVSTATLAKPSELVEIDKPLFG